MRIEKCSPQKAKSLAYVIAQNMEKIYDKLSAFNLNLDRACCSIDNLAFFMEKAVAANHSEIYLIQDYNYIIGCFNLSRIKEYEANLQTGEIEGIYILKPFQGLGYATKGLNFIEHRFKELKYDFIYIWLLNDNKPAINFYTNNGYRFDGKTRSTKYNRILTEQRFSKKIAVNNIVRYYNKSNSS